MSLLLLLPSPRTLLLKNKLCIFCQARQHIPPVRHLTSRTLSILPSTPNRSPLKGYQSKRFYATSTRRTPEQARIELDTVQRKKTFSAAYSGGILSIAPGSANAIILELLSSRRAIDGPKILELCQQYKVELKDMTLLALFTHRIPETKDKSGRLPPSRHKDISAQLLMGCCKAQEPHAILHIMNLAYHSKSKFIPKAVLDSGSRFSASDLRIARKALEEIAARKENVEAMTLLGSFLESEGKVRHAQALYEEAMDLIDPKYEISPQDRLFLPIIPPWNMLGRMLLSQSENSRQRTKEVFELGAFQGDDPLSYYYLAEFEGKDSENWLKYMTKAAASGHVEAMQKLGLYYKELGANNGAKLATVTKSGGKLAKALNWLHSWKATNASERLAIEWLNVAAQLGHWPALLEMSAIHESSGNIISAVKALEVLTEQVPQSETEDWPGLVAEARQRLSRLQK